MADTKCPGPPLLFLNTKNLSAWELHLKLRDSWQGGFRSGYEEGRLAQLKLMTAQPSKPTYHVVERSPISILSKIKDVFGF